MEQEQSNIKPKKNPEEIIKNLRILAEGLKINKQQENNYQTIFIIGNSRVGKSTLFHLLQGDELDINSDNEYDVKCENNSKMENFISHDGLSYTKKFNYFWSMARKYQVFDTPGLEDSSDNFDELVQQVMLHNTMKLYKNIFLLFVVKCKKNNYATLIYTLEYINQLFQSNFQMFEKYKQKICLIITRGKKDDQMRKIVEIIFTKILESEKNQNIHQLIKYFQQNADRVQFFRKNAETDYQQNLKESLNTIISQTNKEDQQNNEIGIMMSTNILSKISEFLSNVQEYFEVNLKLALEKLIYETKNKFQAEQKIDSFAQHHVVEVKNYQNLSKQKDIFNFIFHLLMKGITLNNIVKQMGTMESLVNKYGLFNCFSQIKEDSFFLLFDINLIQSLLKLELNNQTEWIIQTDQIKKSFEQEVIIVHEQLLQLIVNQNERNELQINSIVETIFNFESEKNQKNWEKIILILGNRQSGKSRFINQIYSTETISKIFTENLVVQTKNQQDLIFKKSHVENDFIKLKWINEDFVIEFQSFQLKLVPLVNFFLQQASMEKKKFVIILIFDNNPFDSNVIEGLQNFFNQNQNILTWNFKIMVKYETNNISPPLANQILKQFPFINKNSIQFYKMAEDTYYQNIFSEPLVQSENFLKKTQLINGEFIKTIVEEIVLKLSLQLVRVDNIWRFQSQIKGIENMLQVSKLNANQPDLQKQIQQFCKERQIQMLTKGNKQYTMRRFYELLQLIPNFYLDLQTIIMKAKNVQDNLSAFYFEFFKFFNEQSDILQEIEFIEKIDTLFPSLFKKLEKKERYFEGISKLIKSIYINSHSRQAEFKEWQVIKTIQIKLFNFFSLQSDNLIQNLAWQIKQRVENDVKNLLSLMKKISKITISNNGREDFSNTLQLTTPIDPEELNLSLSNGMYR